MAAKKPRRQRIDSVAGMRNVAEKAAKKILPPKHIRMEKDDMPFFNSVIEEFSRSEWTEHQLELASILARTMCDIERDQYDLRQEGTILKTDKGHPYINPLKGAVNQSAGSILSIRRSLSLHARAREGDPRDAGKRRQMAKKIETAMNDEDELFASPTTH